MIPSHSRIKILAKRDCMVHLDAKGLNNVPKFTMSLIIIYYFLPLIYTLQLKRSDFQEKWLYVWSSFRYCYVAWVRMSSCVATHATEPPSATVALGVCWRRCKWKWSGCTKGTSAGTTGSLLTMEGHPGSNHLQYSTFSQVKVVIFVFL